MQEVLLNYYIKVMLAEKPKRMVKQANLKKIHCYSCGLENIFFSIHRN